MADVWERLAEEHSHSTDLSKPSEQPATQQQQAEDDQED